MMRDYSGGMHYGYFGIGWLFQIVILILFFVVIWWMIKSNGRFGFMTKESETAIDILKKRLAKGEIDTKEYERLRAEIEK